MRTSKHMPSLDRRQTCVLNEDNGMSEPHVYCQAAVQTLRPAVLRIGRNNPLIFLLGLEMIDHPDSSTCQKQDDPESMIKARCIQGCGNHEMLHIYQLMSLAGRNYDKDVEHANQIPYKGY